MVTGVNVLSFLCWRTIYWCAFWLLVWICASL